MEREQNDLFEHCALYALIATGEQLEGKSGREQSTLGWHIIRLRNINEAMGVMSASLD